LLQGKYGILERIEQLVKGKGNGRKLYKVLIVNAVFVRNERGIGTLNSYGKFAKRKSTY